MDARKGGLPGEVQGDARRIDPDGCWWLRRLREAADKPLGVCSVGCLEDRAPCLRPGGCSAIVDIGRSQPADATVVMVVAVPVEEATTVGDGVVDAAEALGEVGTVLEGLEVRL